MQQKIKYLTLLFLIFTLGLTSCKKKDKLDNDTDPSEVNFVLTQPSLAIATFVTKCTNYNVSIDTVIFLDPFSTVYIQDFGGNTFQINEEFTVGGYAPIDGIWTIQFRGKKVDNLENFDISIPYDMNIEEENDE
jgi:hypothetical protein